MIMIKCIMTSCWWLIMWFTTTSSQWTHGDCHCDNDCSQQHCHNEHAGDCTVVTNNIIMMTTLVSWLWQCLWQSCHDHHHHVVMIWNISIMSWCSCSLSWLSQSLSQWQSPCVHCDDVVVNHMINHQHDVMMHLITIMMITARQEGWRTTRTDTLQL